MNRTVHADGSHGGTPVAPPAIAAPPVAVDDLDALIAAAELRVIQRDRRVLQQGEQLKQRLASHGTQARLGALGVIGVTAIVLLSRRRRPKEMRHAHHGFDRQPAAERSSAASWWVPWLPVVLQLLSSSGSSVRPVRPPGMAGLVSMLFSVGRQWIDRAPTRQGPRPGPRDGLG